MEYRFLSLDPRSPGQEARLNQLTEQEHWHVKFATFHMDIEGEESWELLLERDPIHRAHQS